MGQQQLPRSQLVTLTVPALEFKVGHVDLHNRLQQQHANVGARGKTRHISEPCRPALDVGRKASNALWSQVPRPVILRTGQGENRGHFSERGGLGHGSEEADDDAPCKRVGTAIVQRVVDVSRRLNKCISVSGQIS